MRENDIEFLPTFKNNLLSLGMIRQARHQIIMEDGLVKIVRIVNAENTIHNDN
jgi:hypothetical protein